MPTIDYSVETPISRSVRARQMESAFDVPAQQKCSLRWKGELPIESEDWSIGLIVGTVRVREIFIVVAYFRQTEAHDMAGAFDY